MPEEDFEERLFKIIQVFSPRERQQLKRGGRLWEALSVIESFGEKEFSPEDLLQCLQDKKIGNKLDPQDLKTALNRLLENQLILKDFTGKLKFQKIALEALQEAFGFIWKPRAGKTGFIKYLSSNKKRVFTWYLLYQNKKISAKTAHEISGYPLKAGEKLIESLKKENILKGSLNNYFIQNEKKLFQRLFNGYVSNSVGELQLRPLIIELTQRYEKFSAIQILKDLEKMGHYYNRSTIYNQFKVLEGIIEKTGETKKVRGGSYTEYYRYKIKDPKDYVSQLASTISEELAKSELRNLVNNNFYEEIKSEKFIQQPHKLMIFLTDLEYLVVRHENQFQALPIWIMLIKNLPKETVNSVLTKFGATCPTEDGFINKLTELSEKLKLSPFIISMIYLHAKLEIST